MNIKSMQEALNVLIPHYTDPSVEFIEADHDVIYFPATNTPLSIQEITKLVALGLHQEDADDTNGEYLPEEGWAAFT